jgi:protein Tex
VTEDYSARVAQELGLALSGVRAVIELFAEGATVPFIARYRKDQTGSLDEVQILAIRDRLTLITELEKRRAAILASLGERELLSDTLASKVKGAQNLADLEDIYLPFRPKRKTRASAAREKGLLPLAEAILQGREPQAEALKYADIAPDEALAGASDIIAEIISEDAVVRGRLRKLFNRATITSLVAKGKEAEGEKFKDYFDFAESVSSIASHRILAVFRGEAEGFLKVKISLPENAVLLEIYDKHHATRKFMQAVIEDAYKRLLAPAMETECRQLLKSRADKEAISVFTGNLRELLLAPPLGQKNVLAVDPGFRTGCKLAVLDRQGKLLHHTVMYLHESEKAEKIVRALCHDYEIEAIALGNGTASRESDAFLRTLKLAKDGAPLPIVLVNESGASIYSASKVARDEFPDHDITVRGAVSIGRRLMDPLAELVKIEAKSIGVGQYQHDVDQADLATALDDTVMSCVNMVGVELNTASKELLSYVSGLGPQLAQSIVKVREENGPFASRAALKKVPRLGPKAFEQCAGFLRVRQSSNPLDASAVHPERYSVVEKMAKDLGATIKDLLASEDLRKKINRKAYEAEVGSATLCDILAELDKPGLDPRSALEVIRFAEGVNAIEDLKEGMKLPGIVTNVTAFGAFVDIGVHQDGLVHVSEIANKFVKDPSTVVKVNQKVDVTVISVDAQRKRIALSMKR